jgi:PAS domain S-box-containing protein
MEEIPKPLGSPENLTSEQRVNILLVDDQPANLLALEVILQELGHNLVNARSGEEALQRLLGDEFAVLLLDVQMPDLDGFETAKLIRGREKSRHTPIIFLTAFESDHFPVERAYSLGAVDYLVKPLVPIIVRAKVAGFVELFKKTQQIKRQAERLRQVDRREFEQRLAEENKRLWEQQELLRVTLATRWTEDEAQGRPLDTVFKIVNEHSRLPVENPVARVIKGGHAVGLANHTVLIGKDGTERPIDDSAAPIWDEQGRLKGMVLVFRDTTERRRADDDLARSRKEADRRQRLYEAALSNTSIWSMFSTWATASPMPMKACSQCGAGPGTRLSGQDLSRTWLRAVARRHARPGDRASGRHTAAGQGRGSIHRHVRPPHLRVYLRPRPLREW